jgi:pimeloyl-ACP methyl ester carboxylesterase
MMDVPLWHTWEKIACPVLIVRGEHSDFLTADTVQEMQKRGVAAKLGFVQTAAFADCGHAPALMSKNRSTSSPIFSSASGDGSSSDYR